MRMKMKMVNDNDFESGDQTEVRNGTHGDLIQVLTQFNNLKQDQLEMKDYIHTVATCGEARKNFMKQSFRNLDCCPLGLLEKPWNSYKTNSLYWMKLLCYVNMLAVQMLQVCSI